MILWHITEEGAGSTDTEGAGGKMGSWLNDAANWYTKTVANTRAKVLDYTPAGMIYKAATGDRNPVSDYIQREFIDKSELRSSQLLEGISNIPVIGNLVRGVQGVNRLEDLYNNTGRTANYAGSGVSGAGSAASGIREAVKIADGVHDLYEFYTGSPDDFRSMQNNMYG